jgi:hypothetical protein
MHIRKVALAACVALSTLALAGCGLPGLGGGKSDTPASQPTVVPQSSLPATTSAAVPSPSESASTPAPAPVAGLTAMKRPTKPYADPRFPKGPADSRPDTERLAYVFEKMVWKAAGTADAKTTSGKCAIANSTLAKAGLHKFTCTIKYNGVTVRVGVKYTTGSFISNYTYSIDNYPLTRAKAEYSAMYSAYNGVAVACEMKSDTVSVQIGDEQGVLCHVQDTSGDVNDYYLQMSSYGSVYGSRS